MEFADNAQGLLIAACGGIVAALFKLSQERKVRDSDYDYVDFFLQSVTASFVGVVGFLIAKFWLTDPGLVLAATAVASSAGYPFLLRINDALFDAAKQRLNAPVNLPFTQQQYVEGAGQFERAYGPLSAPESDTYKRRFTGDDQA